MFAGFDLSIDRDSFEKSIISNGKTFNDYFEIGREHLEVKKNICNKSLRNYTLNGVTDATKLKEGWFPSVKADIFISHSHKDRELAIALAGWLYEKFNLECFIDSCVWEHIDDLLDEINNKYSDKREDEDGVVYSHKKCNIASAHVNMILNSALQRMIDNTEAVFLINTPNSIERYSETYENSTFSPWIYSEITCTEIIRMKSLSEYREQYIIEHSEIYDSDQLQMEYEVSLDHLNKLECCNLIKWKTNWSKVKNKTYKYSLDELYKIIYHDKFKKK